MRRFKRPSGGLLRRRHRIDRRRIVKAHHQRRIDDALQLQRSAAQQAAAKAPKVELWDDYFGPRYGEPNAGTLEFERDGRTWRLEAIGEPGRELFVIFGDRTSGHGSYPAGRYLDLPAPDAQGRVVIDFNHAYNPPCAFTPFATCPLPPPENRLDLAVEAGEKAYVKPTH